MECSIGVSAEVDAAKTTLPELILLYTGRTHRAGEVLDHTGRGATLDAVIDYLPHPGEATAPARFVDLDGGETFAPTAEPGAAAEGFGPCLAGC